jgi:hypothetical protein
MAAVYEHITLRKLQHTKSPKNKYNSARTTRRFDIVTPLTLFESGGILYAAHNKIRSAKFYNCSCIILVDFLHPPNFPNKTTVSDEGLPPTQWGGLCVGDRKVGNRLPGFLGE